MSGVGDCHVVEAREELAADIAVGLFPGRGEGGGDEAGEREQSTCGEHVGQSQR